MQQGMEFAGRFLLQALGLGELGARDRADRPWPRHRRRLRARQHRRRAGDQSRPVAVTATDLGAEVEAVLVQLQVLLPGDKAAWDANQLPAPSGSRPTERQRLSLGLPCPASGNTAQRASTRAGRITIPGPQPIRVGAMVACQRGHRSRTRQAAHVPNRATTARPDPRRLDPVDLHHRTRRRRRQPGHPRVPDREAPDRAPSVGLRQAHAPPPRHAPTPAVHPRGAPLRTRALVAVTVRDAGAGGAGRSSAHNRRRPCHVVGRRRLLSHRRG